MIAIRKLLSLLAVLALILVPLGRPVMGASADIFTADMHAADMHAADMHAADMHAADMHADMSDATAAPMAADMPCCPDKAPAPDCAKDCPLMALCMAGGVVDFPAAITLVVPHRSVSVSFAENDADRAGLTHGPPPRPPKI
jgi:hypothetical protein